MFWFGLVVMMMMMIAIITIFFFQGITNGWYHPDDDGDLIYIHICSWRVLGWRMTRVRGEI